MKTLIVILILLTMSVTAFAGGGPIGQVIGNSDESDVQYRTLPVHHDTTGRTMDDWSPLEWRLYRSTPATGGLQDEVREMLLGRVIHPPACAYHQNKPVESCSRCGYYIPGSAQRYFTAYQAWTGPAKVTVPLVKGPKGECGPVGPRGPQGPPGQGTVNNFYTFNTVPVMSQPIGGSTPATVVVTQYGSVSWVRPNNTWISVSQSQQQQQQQQQDVAIQE